MNILVVDDTELHRLSAKQCLTGHDVTIASTHAEARNCLRDQEFEVALLDLFMPASGDIQSEVGRRFVGQPTPYGFPLVFLAARNPKMRYIGVVTATNHHDHPICAALDPLTGASWQEQLFPSEKLAFQINEARVGFFHAPWRGVEGVPCTNCDGSGQEKVGRRCYECVGGFKNGKNWTRVLHRLMAGE